MPNSHQHIRRLQVCSFTSVVCFWLTLVSCTTTSTLENQYTAASTRWLISNISIVDLQKGTVLSNQDVAIADGHIISVQAHTNRQHDNVVRGDGKFLLPGLIDSHVHIRSSRDLQEFVKSGVTGVQNMWGIEGWLTLLGMPSTLEHMSAINDDDSFGPTVWSAGPIIEGLEKTNPIMSSFATASAARNEVLRQKQLGYRFIKPYDNLDESTFRALMTAAAEHDMPVKGHVPRSVSLQQAVKMGIQQVEHMTGWLDPDSATALIRPDAQQAVLQEMVSRQVTVCPTLIVYRRVVPAAELKSFESLPGREHQGFFAHFMEYISARSMRKNVSIDITEYLGKIIRLQNKSLLALHGAGVNIVAGTDAGNPYVYPGHSLIEELKLMHEAGLTRHAVLRTATVNAALALNDTRRGLIKPGYVADLVVLNGNPLDDLAELDSVQAVALRGRLLIRNESW